MDYLWSPWRYKYLLDPEKPAGCVFCSISADVCDQEHLIVHRGIHTFVVLNRFPYTSGHLMVIPYAHAADLASIDDAASQELMSTVRVAERKLRAIYKPDGLNIGMNIGKSAGAGIAGHIHMHVVPRWHGDANFMTTVGETRVLPEDLPQTWERVSQAFASPE